MKKYVALLTHANDYKEQFIKTAIAITHFLLVGLLNCTFSFMLHPDKRSKLSKQYD